MFDLGRQNYLIPIRIPQTICKTSTQIGSQISKELGEAEYNNKEQKDSKKETNKHGKWTLRQRMRYLLFLEQNKALFEDTETRKRQKIFSQMSKHIKSRKTSQCKSHHQKVLKIHRNVHNIISFLRQNLGHLKAEWNEFIRTEERVLLNSFTQLNKKQVFYKILEFSDVLKIEINTSYIQSYF